MIDTEDFDHLSSFRWYAAWNKHANTFYAARGVYHNKHKSIVSMHRHLLGVPSGIKIDHRDGNGLNNRKANLRPASTAQNGCNRSSQSNSATGLKGVSFHKRTGKWQAGIQFSGKAKYLGLFATPEDAHSAYVRAAKLIHGEFAHE